MFLLWTKEVRKATSRARGSTNYVLTGNDMEIDSFTRDKVTFSVMYPSVFATIHTVVRADDTSIVVDCGDVDVQETLDVEGRLLRDLRSCSERAFTKFRDEYADMFETSQFDSQHPARLRFRLAHPYARNICVGDELDVAVTPVLVTVRPGRVFVKWSVTPVEDPNCDARWPATEATRAHDVISRAARVRKQIADLEERVKADATHAEEAFQFLQSHGFVDHS